MDLVPQHENLARCSPTICIRLGSPLFGSRLQRHAPLADHQEPRPALTHHPCPHPTTTRNQKTDHDAMRSNSPKILRRVKHLRKTIVGAIMFAVITSTHAADYAPFQYHREPFGADAVASYVYSYDLRLRKDGHVVLYCDPDDILVALNDGNPIRITSRSAEIQFDEQTPFHVALIPGPPHSHVVSGERDVRRIADGLRKHLRMQFTIGQNSPIVLHLNSARESMVRMDHQCDRLTPQSP